MAYRSVLIRWRAKDVVADSPDDPDVAPDAANLPSGTTVTITPAAPEIADLTSQPPVTYYPQKITGIFDSAGDLVGPIDTGGTPINPGVKGIAVIDPTDTNLQPHDFTLTIRVDFGGTRGPITYSSKLTTGEAPNPADTGNPDQLQVYYLTRNAPVPQYVGSATSAAEYAAQAAGSAVTATDAAAVVRTSVASAVTAPPSAAAVTKGLYSRTIPMPTFNGTGAIRPLAKDPNVPGRVWFIETAHDYIGYTDDHGETAATVILNPSHSGGLGASQILFAGADMWLVTSGATGAVGQVWKSPQPDASGNGIAFTKMFDLASPPSGITVGDKSSFRNSCLAVSGSNVYLLEYSVATITGGPSLYYSADGGTTWAKAKTWTNGKHGHAVKIIGGVPWVMIGDAGFSDIGLWTATAANAQAWTRRSLYGEDAGGNTLYGINMQTVTIDGQDVVLSEYDGARSYGPLVFSTQEPTRTRALLPQCAIPGAYVGTMRQMTLTSEGNLMWVQTGEQGAVGPFDTVWISRPPFTVPVLLEALPAAANTFGTMGDPVDDGDYVWFGIQRCRKELFVS